MYVYETDADRKLDDTLKKVSNDFKMGMYSPQ